MSSTQRMIFLSFDVEEFDMPLEYGENIPEKDQLETGNRGLTAVMNVVDAYTGKATFFTTGKFALHYPDAIRSIAKKHEIASHTMFHSAFEVADLQLSRQTLEEITGTPVYGLRMPRMRPVEMEDIKNAGYKYDSSINPTWLPGRYNNMHLPRSFYYEQQMLRVPASVSPRMRIPLFWLSFKNMPYRVFRSLALQALKRDGYLCLYFHPWEFTDISASALPLYTKRWSGQQLCDRLNRLMRDLSAEGDLVTMCEGMSPRFSN